MINIKKILWFVGYSPSKIGSFERLMVNFSKECKNRKIMFKVLFPEEPCEQFKTMVAGNGGEIGVLKFTSRVDPIYIIKLSRVIKRFGPDILHSHFDFANFTSIWAQLINPAPYYIWHQHNFAGSRMPFLRKIVFKIASKKAKCIIAISKSVEKDISDKGMDEKRIHVVYNGIDLNLYDIPAGDQLQLAIRDKYGLSRNDFVVGSVSEAREEKGLQYLIESIPLIKRNSLKWLLVGAKQGPFAAYINKRIGELGITDKVICTEFIDNVHQVLAAIDVVVIPSMMEGLSYGALEALACGKPVIASEIGGLREIIEESKNGLFIKSGDPEAIASAVRNLMDNRLIFDSLKSNARPSVEDNFNLDRNISEIFKLYGIN
ncbi:MAG: glycosyltransferase family 4 protein [Candidatus Aureabacteria bacterium]|nr:glycosyltransferase family 4 protein [Candidatus Auribacterota bacterium]